MFVVVLAVVAVVVPSTEEVVCNASNTMSTLGRNGHALTDGGTVGRQGKAGGGGHARRKKNRKKKVPSNPRLGPPAAPQRTLFRFRRPVARARHVYDAGLVRGLRVGGGAVGPGKRRRGSGK